MANKMLIDASHREETRVVVLRGNRIEEFDFESESRKQLRGNIYLARVTRVEPSLQAAFVEYGGNRHGFLAFSEIHPDYYQIPVADRQALLAQEAAQAREEDDEENGNGRENNAKKRRGRGKRRGGNERGRDKSRAPKEAADGSDEEAMAVAGNDDGAQAALEDGDAEGSSPAIAAATESEVVSEAYDKRGDRDSDHDDDDDDNGNEDQVESVGAEDALEEVPDRHRNARRQYKIQEVIKRRQILLVQVVKEERGNKGAALTTYLSLAGRYSVLMPNTARGGGISRKITQIQDRKRLKEIVHELEVPDGMGVILRTAGANRTKAEVKRDYEYLMRLWENVRNLTLQSTAPCLVYEEGSLIKRAIRDLYNKDIDEIMVAGDDGYREAKDFMRMLMPSHAKAVQPYKETLPIFTRAGIEAQLDKMLQPQVTLKSGGYIIINQTEALVSIDVNSGRSTREHSIEDTALQTNLEAAEEVARQLRLRDLAGLIVIDFIDMDENRNNRAVEKRIKDCLKQDRARIQVGRISHFGLLEMSRQRIRASVLESAMKPCQHCGGIGLVRSDSSEALHVIRSMEEFLLKNPSNDIKLRTSTHTALYILNQKRANIVELENRFGLRIVIEADDTLGHQHYAIEKGEPARGPTTPLISNQAPPLADEYVDEPEIDEDIGDEEPVSERDTVARDGNGNGDGDTDGEGGRKRRRRRRRRRGGRDRDEDRQQEARPAGADQPRLKGDEGEDADGEMEPVETVNSGSDDATESAAPGADGEPRRKRRRGKRGGRRNRGEEDGVSASAAQDEPAEDEADVVAAIDTKATASESQPEPEAAAEPEAEAETAEVVEKPKRKRAPRKSAKAASAETAGETSQVVSEATAESKPPQAEPAAVAETVTRAPEPAEEPSKPKRSGWWQKRGFL